MDEKINKALLLFAEHKTRHEVAKLMGYSNFKALDMYFRRKNYRWCADQGTYTPHQTSEPSKETVREVVSSKAQRIIAQLSVRDNDPREVAKQIGFTSIQLMADYMAEKGFSWDSERNNYVSQTGGFETAALDTKPTEITEPISDNQPPQIETPPVSHPLPADFSDHLSLLTFLQKHKDRLIDLLTVRQEENMPRYMIAGSCTAKSLQIPIALDKIVKAFSAEKKITQKDVLTIALIEFLAKYGYDTEVDYMLKTSSASERYY